MMNAMRRRKPEPTLYRLKVFNLPWYERNWLLITLKVIHSREMDCSTAKCYDRIHTPSPESTTPCLSYLPTPLYVMYKVLCEYKDM